MSSNKRAEQRFSIKRQAKISYRHAPDRSEIIETVAADISASGVFIETPQKIALASKVQIEFYLHLDELKKLKFVLSVNTLKNLRSEQVLVTARGVVIRQTERGAGIIFDTNYQLKPL